MVVFGGLEEYIRDGRDDSHQPMKTATVVLEFGNYIIIILGAYPHIELCLLLCRAAAEWEW